MAEGVTNNYTVNNQVPNSFGVMRNRVSTPVKTTTVGRVDFSLPLLLESKRPV